MRQATAAERQRLNETFSTLCRIESPSGRERRCADWVAAELRTMGLVVTEDDAGPRAGSDAGNLLTRVDGRQEAAFLICTHLDTVPLTARVEPVLVDGGWENSGDGVLGADNKAAVAVAVELARRLTGDGERPPVTVELLFTVCEEPGLRGAKAFEPSALHSQFGYAFDHATPIGEVVLSSPTYYRITAEVRGRAAHAGIRPEDGRSAIAAAAQGIAAMTLGRLDSQTTANVGTIAGGSSPNVVPEHCRLVAETRSLDQVRAEAIATEMVDHLQDGADRAECDLDVEVERVFDGYRTRDSEPQVVLAELALRRSGYEPRHIVTGGGSDANALQAAGFPCTNLANGTERNHQPDERVSVEALEGMLEVAIALVEEAEGVLGG